MYWLELTWKNWIHVRKCTFFWLYSFLLFFIITVYKDKVSLVKRHLVIFFLLDSSLLAVIESIVIFKKMCDSQNNNLWFSIQNNVEIIKKQDHQSSFILLNSKSSTKIHYSRPKTPKLRIAHAQYDWKTRFLNLYAHWARWPHNCSNIVLCAA